MEGWAAEKSDYIAKDKHTARYSGRKEQVSRFTSVIPILSHCVAHYLSGQLPKKSLDSTTTEKMHNKESIQKNTDFKSGYGWRENSLDAVSLKAFKTRMKTEISSSW